MKKPFIAFVFVLVTLGLAVAANQLASDDLEKETHKLINAHRKKKKLSTLKLDDTLSDIARKHSKNMATGKVPFGHDGFSARVEKIKKSMKSYGWAENVSYNSTSAPAKRAVEQWLGSKGHKKNIETKDFTHTGIGVYEKNGVCYFTQLFAEVK